MWLKAAAFSFSCSVMVFIFICLQTNLFEIIQLIRKNELFPTSSRDMELYIQLLPLVKDLKIKSILNNVPVPKVAKSLTGFFIDFFYFNFH